MSGTYRATRENRMHDEMSRTCDYSDTRIPHSDKNSGFCLLFWGFLPGHCIPHWVTDWPGHWYHLSILAFTCLPVFLLRWEIEYVVENWIKQWNHTTDGEGELYTVSRLPSLGIPGTWCFLSITSLNSQIWSLWHKNLVITNTPPLPHGPTVSVWP